MNATNKKPARPVESGQTAAPDRVSPWKMSLSLLPLCVMLAATALVVQNAHALQLSITPDDALLPPILDFIQPAADIILATGYIIALIVIYVTFFKERDE